jgi:hypothetical protein
LLGKRANGELATLKLNDNFYHLNMDNDLYQYNMGVAMKKTPREFNTDFCFAENMKRTPRELNTSYDLAQQKIIHLKTRNYCFDPIGNVVRQWIAEPTASNVVNMPLIEEVIPKRRQI